MAAPRERILGALEELSAADLRRFKWVLNRLEPVPGRLGGWVGGPIPWGRLEGADVIALSDVIVGFYGLEGATAATAEALRRSQRRDLAGKLVGEASAPSRPRDDLTADLTADITTPPSPAELWVARHRPALVQRVRGVAAILDQLQAEGVVTDEAAGVVAAGVTPQERMRRLLATAPAWGHRGHGVFLRALRDVQPGLFQELQEGTSGGFSGASGGSGTF